MADQSFDDPRYSEVRAKERIARKAPYKAGPRILPEHTIAGKGAPTLFAIPLSLRSWMLLTVPVERMTLPPEPLDHVIATLVDKPPTGANQRYAGYTDPADLQRDVYHNAKGMGVGVLIEELPATGSDLPIVIGPRFSELFPSLARLMRRR